MWDVRPHQPPILHPFIKRSVHPSQPWWTFLAQDDDNAFLQWALASLIQTGPRTWLMQWISWWFVKVMVTEGNQFSRYENWHLRHCAHYLWITKFWRLQRRGVWVIFTHLKAVSKPNESVSSHLIQGEQFYLNILSCFSLYCFSSTSFFSWCFFKSYKSELMWSC